MTIKAAFNTSPARLRAAINKQRETFIDNIIAADPSQKVFEKGWKNRINKFKEPNQLT
jgi:hypothetical protein